MDRSLLWKKAREDKNGKVDDEVAVVAKVIVSSIYMTKCKLRLPK